MSRVRISPLRPDTVCSSLLDKEKLLSFLRCFNGLIGRKTIEKLRSQGRITTQGFRGKTHSENSKEQMRAAKTGKFTGNENSQYGTCWIWHNDFGNRKIKKEFLDEHLSIGWKPGRKIKRIGVIE